MAVQQYLSLNEMNPAGLDLKGFTMISASFQGEIVNNTVSGETAQTRQGRASGFRFVVPIIKTKLALLAGLKPLTKAEMAIEFDQQIDDLTMMRSIGASGGLSAASIGLKYSITEKLHVGGVFNFNFGSFHESWATEFDDESYKDAKDDISSHMWGTGAEVGLIYNPIAFVSLAGIVRTGSNMHIETTITPGSGIALEPITQSASYPLAFGVGSAIDFTKVLIAADYYVQKWQDYRLDGKSLSMLKDYSRMSVGIEYIDSKDFLSSYHRRIAFRIGGSWAQLPLYDQLGDPVQELLGTVGFGFPFNKNLGRIDIALEAGKRYSTDAFPYSEQIMRISACVTSAERWFQRVF